MDIDEENTKESDSEEINAEPQANSRENVEDRGLDSHFHGNDGKNENEETETVLEEDKEEDVLDSENVEEVVEETVQEPALKETDLDSRFHGNDKEESETEKKVKSGSGDVNIQKFKNLSREEKKGRFEESYFPIEQARVKVQEKKQAKLDKIMDKIREKHTITNNEVERLIQVSDATATRYLDILEKQGKIKQIGVVGKGVEYEILG